MIALSSQAPSARGRLQELYSYRELLYNLVVRDLKLKYKSSVLGIAWSFINPLLMMAIYTAVFSLFLRAVRLPHYWAYVLVGVLIWTFVSGSLSQAAVTFVRNANLVTKVYFPIEALPLSGGLANFVNFAIMLTVLLVILAVAGLPLGAPLVLLPVFIAALLAMVIGLSLLLASVTVHFRDIEHLLQIGLAAWFYVTPILYPLDAAALPKGAGRFIPFVQANPLSWYLQSAESILYYGRWPDARIFGATLLSAAAVLALGYWTFLKLRPQLPEAL